MAAVLRAEASPNLGVAQSRLPKQANQHVHWWAAGGVTGGVTGGVASPLEGVREGGVPYMVRNFLKELSRWIWNWLANAPS